MIKIPLFVEKGFIVFCLLFSTGASRVLLSASDPTGEGTSSSLLQVMWLGIYIVILLLLLPMRKQAVMAAARGKLLWVLVGIALLSTFWSIAPSITLRRGIALLGTNLFGIYLAIRYDLKEQLRLLAWALGIGAVLSVVVAIVMPSYGLDPGGLWRGVYAQKNILARLMVLSTMVFLLLAIDSHRHRWIAWAMFSLSIGLTVLSGSSTGLVTIITLLVLFILYRTLRLQYTLAIPLTIFTTLTAGSAAIWLSNNSELLFQSLGKDATFTGRTKLWDIMFVLIGKRPILGYGYGSFWTSGWGGPAGFVWQVVGWQPVHSHNGLIDLCLELGLLGLSVFLLQYFLLAIKAVNWIQLTKTAEGFWPLIYLTFLFMYNQTESTILGQNNIFWILYVALGFTKGISSVQKSKTAV